MCLVSTSTVHRAGQLCALDRSACCPSPRLGLLPARRLGLLPLPSITIKCHINPGSWERDPDEGHTFTLEPLCSKTF